MSWVCHGRNRALKRFRLKCRFRLAKSGTYCIVRRFTSARSASQGPFCMDFMPDSPLWLIYLGVAIGPFVQEDAAVFTAGTLSANGMYNSTTLFIVILLGLIASDAWKYWIGRVALKNPRAKAYAEKQHVTDFKDKVKRHLGVTLLTVRFVPLARVPTYVACGFFHVSYLRYLFWISISALLYVIAVFL